jgi:tripartite-type tricarboxylate transporter receptor subunit TctC
MFLSSTGALRRNIAAALFAFPLFASVVHAQAAYPNKSIKFVVPYAAGGFPDTVARIIAQRLSVTLGQSVIVDNRPVPMAGSPPVCLRRGPPTAINSC